MHAAVIGALASCLVALVAATALTVARQHQRLLDLTAAERSSQLEDATARVAEDFEDVTGNLAFALQQVGQAPDEDAARRSLAALLGSVRRYQSAALVGPGCEPGLVVDDPRWSWSHDPTLKETLAATVVRACQEASASVIVSRPLTDPRLKWFRVFAMAGPSSDGGTSAVGLVVDTAPVLDRLRTLTADPSAELLVLGPHGTPAPVTGPLSAAAVLGGESPSLSALVRRMRAGEGGSAVIPAGEAGALGWPDADLLAVFRPIPLADSSSGWSAAILLSLAPVEAHERSLAVALIASAAAGTALLGLLVAYVVRVGRAEAAAEDRLRTAEQLAHLRERAERILDHVPAGVLALGRDGTVTSANVTIARRAGRRLVGLPFSELLAADPPETARQLQQLVGEAVQTRQPQELTAARLTLLGRDGTCTVHAVPIQPPSEEVAALLVVDDLTELRALQDQLLRSEKLATVGVLAAGLAHEVGTPLGVIRGRAELVARRLGPDHGQARSLVAIIEQIDLISRTIRALMDFATPMPSTAATLELGTVLARVRELLHYESEKRRVALRCEVRGEPTRVRADADQLQQILVNLVINAFDASSAGSEVRVEAGRSAEPSLAGWASLTVTDRGTGIHPDHIHRIFDPFFTTKKRGHGTGLGLAVVNQIVRDHGGVLRVDSQPGRGTTVEVHLPPAEGGDRG